jgi:iron complex outermembrane recepter protein
MSHRHSTAFFALAAVVSAAGTSWAQSLPAREGVRPPTVVNHVDAVYPPSALASQEHGDVTLALTLDGDGHVSKVEVMQSSGARDLDEAAIVAARRWTFTPASRDGKPIASRIRVPFRFAPPASSPEVASPSPTEEPRLPEQSAENPTEVEVRAKLEARSHGTSDYQVTLGAQQAVPRTNPSDLLKLAPGFLLTNEGGAGHAEQIFMRGFDAKEGQDLEFTVDGVPINDAGNYHGNGYADTHFIIPELVHSVRVLEGPYAPQQGDFAVAGSADFQMGLDRRGLTMQYETGSFNTQRFLILYGPSDSGPGTFGGAEYYTTDGFGVNRQAKRGKGMGQYEIPVGAKGVLRVNATAYATDYNSAGVVREDDYQSGRVTFYGTEDPNQVGNTASRLSFAATYENRFRDIDVSQQIFVVDRSMRLLEDWTGFLNDVQEPTQVPHGQRGDMIDFHFNEVTMGGRGFARWRGELFGMKQEFEGGYFARVDETTSIEYRDMAANQDPYLTDANLTSTLADIGVYVDGNVRLQPWLALRGGVRAEMFMFDVLNNCAVSSSVGVDSPSNTYLEVDQPCLSELEHGLYREPIQRSSTGDGAILPRGTILMGPFGHFEFTASAGNGIRSVDPSYIATGLLTPFVNIESQDIGVSYSNDLGPFDLAAKSLFFRTHSDQDLIFDPTAGRSTLSTGSTRSGWSGSVRGRGSFFDVSANATVVKSTFDDTGLLVPYVPDLLLRADVVLFHDLPWRVVHERMHGSIGYGVDYVGRRPLPYSELSDVYFISDASLGLKWSLFGVRLIGRNLFDSRYKLSEFNYASDFHSQTEPTLVPERSFTAGEPRTILLSLSMTLGGGAQ